MRSPPQTSPLVFEGAEPRGFKPANFSEAGWSIPATALPAESRVDIARRQVRVKGRQTRNGGSGGVSRAVAASGGPLYPAVQVHKALRLRPRVPGSAGLEPLHSHPRLPLQGEMHREDHHRHPHDPRVQPVAPRLGVDLRRHNHLSRGRGGAMERQGGHQSGAGERRAAVRSRDECKRQQFASLASRLRHRRGHRVQRQVPTQPVQEDRRRVHLRVHVGVGGRGAGHPPERLALGGCLVRRGPLVAVCVGDEGGGARRRSLARPPQARATEVHATPGGHATQGGALRRRRRGRLRRRPPGRRAVLRVDPRHRVGGDDATRRGRRRRIRGGDDDDVGGGVELIGGVDHRRDRDGGTRRVRRVSRRRSRRGAGRRRLE